MIKVSVIVPVYNTEPYLYACVQSLVRQTLKDIEIILVDDGSSDNSPSLCDEYAKSDSRIKVIHKKNGGPSHARNEGLDAASGEYTTFCDSDDYIALNAYEVCYNLAKQANADEVRFLMRRFSGEADIKKASVSEKHTIADTMIDRLNPLLANMAPLLSEGNPMVKSDASQCTGIYRTAIIKKKNLRFSSEKEFVSEDFFFNIDFGIACKTIVFTENSFYNYRHNPQSISMAFNPKRHTQNLVIFPKLLAAKLERINYPAADTFASGHMFSALFAFIKHIFKSNLPLKEKKAIYRNLPFNVLKNVYANYPVSVLPAAKRIRFQIVVSENFWLCLLFEKAKNLLLKLHRD